jgi:hypothetical protein
LIKVHRLWLEVLLLGTAIAFGVALLVATFTAVAGAVEGDSAQAAVSHNSSEKSFEGMITCSKCGAKHSTKVDQNAEVCVRVCVHGGASFALLSGDSAYVLDGDLVALKKLAGQRVRIVGELNGNTIKVSSATAQS